jgi:hypothetical protein
MHLQMTSAIRKDLLMDYLHIKLHAVYHNTSLERTLSLFSNEKSMIFLIISPTNTAAVEAHKHQLHKACLPQPTWCDITRHQSANIRTRYSKQDIWEAGNSREKHGHIDGKKICINDTCLLQTAVQF